LREAERKHGVCLRLAEAMPDRRDPDRIQHAMFEMVMSRVLAIACGHEYVLDLDRLRHDPLMKLAVGRCPESGQPLASQSTISRLENAPSKTEAARLQLWSIRPTRQRSRASRNSTSTTHSVRHMAVSSSRSGTRITTSAASRRCTSITWQAVRRL
jgi:hypothetical protein